MAVVQLQPRPARKRTRQKRKLPGDPKYYDRIGRMGYWQPGKALRKIGYRNVCCGLDGPEAIAIAENMNREAFAVKAVADAAQAALGVGPSKVSAAIEAWQRPQTQKSEAQTEKFEVQTSEFESGGGIQTSQFEVRARRWFKWLAS